MTNDIPTQRQVARATRAGGPDVLALAVEDLRPLKAGEALVRVEAAGLNHVDSLVRSGTYSIRFEFPSTSEWKALALSLPWARALRYLRGHECAGRLSSDRVRITSSRQYRCWRNCQRA